MGVRVPRITIKTDYGDDSSFGDLTLLSVGYGLHQAWVYATMFGTGAIFGTQSLVSGMYGTEATFAYLVSAVVYSACLLFAAATDQRFLALYVSKKTLVAGAALACVGTLLLLAPPTVDPYALQIASGTATGIGSATLILFWGVAFARCDSASIVLNASVAIPVGIGVYTIALHYLPFPFAGVLAAAIPLLELAILWNKTPRPFSERNEVPIFAPLPVNHAKFFVRFGVPVLVFGVALGALRQTSVQFILPAATADSQLLMLLAAGCATVIILITILALGGAGRWSRYFRPLVPFIAVTMLFLPFAETGDALFSNLALLIGYLCFEALMWIFFGELAQRFRLSPVFVYGLGRGMLALGITAGSLMPVFAASWIDALPFGEHGVIVAVLLIMVCAYALLPREREIEGIVIPCPLVKAVSTNLEHGMVAPLASASVAASAPTPAPVAASLAPGHMPARSTADDLSSQQAQPSQLQASAKAPAPSPAIPAMPTRSPAADAAAEEQRRGGRFRAKCETVANTFLLSSRETEVMFFLAKGHNAAYIQEKLYISEGTAKTHIRHIYRKLDVHTQQELMRLVESVEGTE